MKRQLVILWVILSTLAVMFTFAPVVLAGTQGSCSPGGSAGSVRVWENSTGDSSDGNDSWWAVCNSASGWTDLNVSPIFSLPGHCQGAFGNSNWNDCISSYTVWLPGSTWRLCLYGQKDYNTLYPVITNKVGPISGVRYNIPSGQGNDGTSSLRIRYLSTGC